jgi:hypothetical protein
MALQTFQFKAQVSWLAGACLLAGLTMPGQVAGAQQPAVVSAIPEHAIAGQPEGTPRSWAEAAIRNELSIIDAEDKVPLRYRQRKVDAKGDITREIIESKDGNVARLVERNGEPITAAEDAAELDRLKEDIAAPYDFIKHHRRDSETRDEAMKLVLLLPQAMIYSYAPGQPQQKGADGQQVVLDFHPDPTFRPPTMFADMLTGLEGRVWIDSRSRCMTRTEAQVLHPVNIGFGFVAKIFPGGTVELEQTHASGDRWVYSHLDEHLTARVLMVKTLPENAAITSWDFRPMPSLPYQDALRALLAMTIPLRQGFSQPRQRHGATFDDAR